MADRIGLLTKSVKLIKLINMAETIKKITAFEARTHLGEMLDYVRYSRKPCLIERHGKPVAAIIDYKTYQEKALPEQYRQWVARAVEQIRIHLRPQKIILFGSAAKGNIKEGSDIDLFIIKETSKRKLDRIDEALNILDPENPVELHIYTPQEVEERLAIGDFFVEQVMNEGKILYDEKRE